jgi:hypothetical protein
MTNTLGWIFISASSLKQSAGRYVTALGHIILIPSQPVFALTPCNADVFGKWCITVMVTVPVGSVVYHGLEHRLNQTKDYKIGICCFSQKHQHYKE